MTGQSKSDKCQKEMLRVEDIVDGRRLGRNTE